MANPWDSDPIVDPFEDALKAEGLTGQAAAIARSIYQQESSSGKNTKTSNAGAVGGMQIIPATFKSVADKDWNINDPTQNARAGIRYVKQLYEQAGGDPALTAAGYYGGPGGLEKARRGVAVSDPRNPSAPTTLQYGEQVAARIPKEKGLIQRGVEAVIPSANAATGNPWDNDPIVEAEPAQPAAKAAQPEIGIGTKVLRGLGGALGPGQVVADLATGGTFSRDVAAGLVRGAGSIGATLARPFESGDENAQRRAAIDTSLSEMGADTKSLGYGGGKLAAEVAGTAGVGNVIGAPLRAAGATGTVVNRLGTALATGGASTGAPVAQGIAPAAGNMLLRMAGGAGSGAATAGLIDPNTAGTGAVIGGVLPPATALVGKVANTAGALIRPFTSGGQDRIAGNVLRELSTDPAAARAALQGAAPVVPGSMPTAATASGDAGIAALSRTMQNASTDYASSLAARQTAQNQARTAALEGIAGNTGKLDIAKQARNAVTGPMREEALNAAGKVPAQGILQRIDDLIADPNNAGQISQQALSQFRSRIAGFSKDGAIDARALYAIRKDINDVLGGKLQGEAGNLRHASSQLSGVKSFIDDAIDQSSRSMPSNAIGPTTRGVPNWKGYLQKYADESIPINQMEKLEEVLKSIQTGTVDSQGGAIISSAKLNNILKNQGAELGKQLSPAQLQVLRNIQADLNATQIANNVGRSVGSNTVQNFAQNQLLETALGRTLGGSTAASSTLGRLLQVPYGTANKQIQERLGGALLNPQEAARLLAEPQSNTLLQALTQNQIPYKVAPAISAR
jgi:soluble lytic murein transglycosylase-like protein